MDISVTERLRLHLLPGESLQWVGRPKQGIVFRAIDFFLVPFSMIWCGGVSFGFYHALTSGQKFPIVVTGFMFSMGLYILLGRFIVDMRLRERTWFGLTQNRAIILIHWFQPSVRSVVVNTIGEISLSQNMNGTQSIVFGSDGARSMRGLHMPGTGSTLAPCFEMISDGDDVYKLVQKMQMQRNSTDESAPRRTL